MALGSGVAEANALRRGGVRSWSLWTVRPAALTAVLLTDAAAIAVTLLVLLRDDVTGGDLGRFVLIFALAATFTEVSDRVDRLRRYVGGEHATVGSMSVWAVAAAITLPTGLAATMVVALGCHSLARARSHKSVRPHRLILTCATLVLATAAASAAASSISRSWTFIPDGPRLLASVLAATISFQVVNFGLVCVVIYLVMKPTSWRALLISFDELAFEYVTLILGVFTGVVVLHSPWVSPAVLPVLALLYRASMVSQLQVQSTVDQKTGLLNFTSWRETASRALLRTERSQQPVAVLLIDLDHFKRVNDTHGHLIGDEVLTAVADCIKSDLREYDVVGRFGGEEFVLLLDGADLYAAVAAATRVRENIGQLVVGDDVRVTASIGIAHSVKSSVTLDALMERADVALYEAKAAGRNTVRALAVFAEVPGDAVA